MHEYSIISALLDSVETHTLHAGAGDAGAVIDVRRIRVQIGDVSGVDVALLTTAFEVFREGTICANAEMEVVRKAADWGCTACGAAIRLGDILRCPLCGGPAKLRGGDEIILEQIELEVAESCVKTLQ